MSDELIFDTTVQNGQSAGEPAEPETMQIDKEHLVIHEPKKSLLLRVALSEHMSAVEQSAALLALVDGCLEPEGRSYIRKRLDDPDDMGLDIDFVCGPMANALLSKYSGRPTTPPSGSSRRRRPTKKASSAASPSKG